MKTKAFKKTLSVFLSLLMVLGMFSVLGAVSFASIEGVPTRTNAINQDWYSDATLYGAEKWDKTTGLGTLTFNWSAYSGSIGYDPQPGRLTFAYPSHIYLNVGETLEGAGYMGHMTASYGENDGSDVTDFRVMLSSATWGESTRAGFGDVIGTLISGYGHQGTCTEGTKLMSGSSSHYDFSNDGRGSDQIIGDKSGDNENFLAARESVVVWRSNIQWTGSEMNNFDEYVLFKGTANKTGEVTFDPTANFTIGAAQRYTAFAWHSDNGTRFNRFLMSGGSRPQVAPAEDALSITFTVYDKSELSRLIAAADNGTLTVNDPAALAAARTVLADREVTQAQIDAAAAAIGDRMTMLVNDHIDDYTSTAATTGLGTEVNTFNAHAFHQGADTYGGYSNLVYAPIWSTSWSGDGQGDVAWGVGRTDFKVAVPRNVVMVYDGVSGHEPYAPITLESRCNDTGGSSHIIHYADYNNAGSSFEVKNDFWQGYSTAWDVWAKDSIAASEKFAAYWHDGGAPGESPDSQRDGNSRFWWNCIQYFGTGNTTSYYDHETNFKFDAHTSYKSTSRQHKYGTFTSKTDFYTINYQPIYSKLADAAAVKTIIEGDTAWQYTEASVRRAKATIMAMIASNPNNFFNNNQKFYEDYDADTAAVAAAVEDCAAAIKDAVYMLDNDGLTLVKKQGTVTFVDQLGNTISINGSPATYTKDYGETVAANEIPQLSNAYYRPDNAQWDYSETLSWTPAIEGNTILVDEPEKVYQINDTQTIQTYTVTFYDDDETTVLATADWQYGDYPDYGGTIIKQNGDDATVTAPTKQDYDYNYVAIGWTDGEDNAFDGLNAILNPFTAEGANYNSRAYLAGDKFTKYVAVYEKTAREDADYTAYEAAKAAAEAVRDMEGIKAADAVAIQQIIDQAEALAHDTTVTPSRNYRSDDETGVQNIADAVALLQSVVSTYTDGEGNILDEHKETYAITVTPGTNTTLTVKNGDTVVNSGDAVPYGTVLTIEAAPATGYDQNNTVTVKVNGEAYTASTVTVTASTEISTDPLTEANTYTITFIARCGDAEFPLYTQTVKHGWALMRQIDDPADRRIEDKVWRFSAWSDGHTGGQGVVYSADTTVYADYVLTDEVAKYTVTFLNDDNYTKLAEGEYEWNEPVVVPGTPVSTRRTVALDYTFLGWTPEVAANVTGDATYVATYETEAHSRVYHVKWVWGEANTVKKEADLPYNTVFTADHIPADVFVQDDDVTHIKWSWSERVGRSLADHVGNTTTEAIITASKSYEQHVREGELEPVWTGNDADGYTKVTLTGTCTVCDQVITEEQDADHYHHDGENCQDQSYDQYTAFFYKTFFTGDAISYRAEKIVYGEYGDHFYPSSDVKVTWNTDDPANVTCVITEDCYYCDNVRSYDGEVSVKEATPASCVSPAITVFKAEFENWTTQESDPVETAPIDPTAHNYDGWNVRPDDARCTRPTENADGTWTKGTLVIPCANTYTLDYNYDPETGAMNVTFNYTVADYAAHDLVIENLDRADYDAFDEALAKFRAINELDIADDTVILSETYGDQTEEMTFGEFRDTYFDRMLEQAEAFPQNLITIPEGHEYERFDEQPQVDQMTEQMQFAINLFFNEDGTVKEELLNTYTVSFVTEGTAVEAVTGAHKGDALTLAASEKDGWHFDGWFTDEERTVAVTLNDEQKYIVTGDATLYAKFTELSLDPDDIDNEIKDIIKDVVDADGNLLYGVCYTDESLTAYNDALAAVEAFKGQTATAETLAAYDAALTALEAAVAGLTVEHDYSGEPSLTRPVYDETTGTWSKGVYTWICQNDSTHDVVTMEVERADYSEFDELAEKLEEILGLDLDETLEIPTEDELGNPTTVTLGEILEEIEMILDELEDFPRDLVVTEGNDPEDPLNEQPEVDGIVDELSELLDIFFNPDGTVKEELIKKYTVTWSVDGVESTEQYLKGDLPDFKGSTDKDDDALYTYTFTGWDPEPLAVTEDATYTAQYSKAYNDHVKDVIEEAEEIIGSDDFKDEYKDDLQELLDVLDDSVLPVATDEEKEAALDELEDLLDEKDDHREELDEYADYDDVLAEIEDLLADEGIDPEVKEAIEQQLADIDDTVVDENDERFTKPGTDDEKQAVIDATDALRDILNDLDKDGDGELDDDKKADLDEYQDYDEALEKVNELLNDPDIDPALKAEIEEQLADIADTVVDDDDERFKKPGTDEEKQAVTDATAALNDIIASLDGDDDGELDEANKAYTVTFVNGATGETIKSEKVKVGEIPSCELPVKEDDALYTYTYAWDQAFVAVTGDATYTANETKTYNDHVKDLIDEAEDVADDETYDEDYRDGIQDDLDVLADPDATDDEKKAAVEDLERKLTDDEKAANVLHTLTVKYENGAADKTLRGKTGAVVTIDDAYPTKEGYAFTGWTADKGAASGKTYTFADGDATVTAGWYDLSELNDAIDDAEDLLDDENLDEAYKDEIQEILDEIDEILDNPPVDEDELEDLLDELADKISDEEQAKNTLHTLTVYANGAVVRTVRGKEGDRVNLAVPAAPDKFYFTGWTVTAGSVNGNDYTFARADAEAVANFKLDPTVAEDLIDKAEDILGEGDDVYEEDYLDELQEKLDELNDAINNGADEETVKNLLDELEAIVNDANNNKHVWGPWEIVKEADFGVTGLKRRYCTKDGCTHYQEMEYNISANLDREIQFTNMHGMHYIAHMGETDRYVYTDSKALKWYSGASLTFNVVTGSSFRYDDYVIFMNGQVLEANADGSFTIPAGDNRVVITIVGAVKGGDDQGATPSSGSGVCKLCGKDHGTTIWGRIVAFFHLIVYFFKNLFK